jgi:hypothetical protein
MVHALPAPVPCADGARLAATRLDQARAIRAAWDGFGPYPAPAINDAHHVLSEYHQYEAIRDLAGDSVAEAESGRGVREHAATLAATLAEVLIEAAALRVLAAESVVPPAPSGA